MNNYRIFTIAIVAIIMSAIGNVYAKNPEVDNNILKGKKVLYVYGGWDGHQPKECRDVFVPWLKSEGAEVFEYQDLTCYDDSVLMANVDLIIQHFTMSKITGSQEKNLWVRAASPCISSNIAPTSTDTIIPSSSIQIGRAHV